MGRRYRQARRAELVADTRRRITQAAMELHATLGPARTTISGVAERAGVQRLTVYRHFPDEAALFQACTSQWLADNPPPDSAPWTAHADPRHRLRHALRELYAYFARTAPMWERAYRDAPLVDALQGPMAAWLAYLDRARELLLEPWRTAGRARARLAIAIGHALAFPTWASLTSRGCDAEAAAALMEDMVSGVARPAAPPAPRRTGHGSTRRRVTYN